MDGEALQGPRSSQRAENQTPFPPELFAALLLRRPFAALEPDHDTIVRWAKAEATRRMSRETLAEDALAYRFVYRSLRAEAAAAPPVEEEPKAPRWERVLRAACNLRHRQRAALTLYYCAATPVADVARILGVSAREGRTVIEGAVAAVARALGEPVDVRRSMRMASARLRRRADDAERGWSMDLAPESVERPAGVPRTAPDPHQPRRVIRAWITAPLGAPELRPRIAAARSRPPVIPKGSPVMALLAEHPIVAELPPAGPAPTPLRVAPTPRRSRWQIAIAAAAALLVAAVLVPVSADGPTALPAERTVELTPTPEVAIAPAPPVAEVAGRALITVRRGDSLWSIAAEVLGDPLRWPELWERNRDRKMSAGERFTDPNLIRPRWVLRVPRAS